MALLANQEHGVVDALVDLLILFPDVTYFFVKENFSNDILFKRLPVLVVDVFGKDLVVGLVEPLYLFVRVQFVQLVLFEVLEFDFVDDRGNNGYKAVVAECELGLGKKIDRLSITC